MISVLRGHNARHVAFIETSPYLEITYGRLIRFIDDVSSVLRHRIKKRSLIVLHAANTLDSIVVYLACLSMRYPVVILEDTYVHILPVYKFPPIIIPIAETPPKEYTNAYRIPFTSLVLYMTDRKWAYPMNPKLALLMSTSGSTGSPKLVRLSLQNITSNAQSIAAYLRLTWKDRSVQSLPMYYSYGLSLINSHLYAGGTTVLTPHSFMRKEFWNDVDRERCTSFAGVPYMYEVLHRMKFDFNDHPSLRMLTQSGGVLRLSIKQHFYEQFNHGRKEFFAMYGQLEATTRISYVPPHMLGKKIGSIGIPVPNGSIKIQKTKDGFDEIVYTGKNVMLGYAADIASLADPDQCHGTIHTGDAGLVDGDGYYYYLGRIKHFMKLYGKGVNLREVEEYLEKQFSRRFACVDNKDEEHIHIFVEQPHETDHKDMVRSVMQLLGIPPGAVKMYSISELPRTERNKVDYQSLIGRL
jgi:acyl-CoA synthetase (AMP-forming)/AMP-acid ligase II